MSASRLPPALNGVWEESRTLRTLTWAIAFFDL